MVVFLACSMTGASATAPHRILSIYNLSNNCQSTSLVHHLLFPRGALELVVIFDFDTAALLVQDYEFKV